MANCLNRRPEHQAKRNIPRQNACDNISATRTGSYSLEVSYDDYTASKTILIMPASEKRMTRPSSSIRRTRFEPLPGRTQSHDRGTPWEGLVPSALGRGGAG